MKPAAIVVVALLSAALPGSALAQTSAWDFTRKDSPAADAAAPKDVAKKPAASSEPAVAKVAATPPSPSPAPAVTPARPAVVVKTSAAAPAAASRVVTSGPSRRAQRPVTTARDAKVAVDRLVWDEPAVAVHGVASVTPAGRVVLHWSTGAAGRVAPASNDYPSSRRVAVSESATAPTAPAPTLATSSESAPAAPRQGIRPVEARKPPPTGLERLSDDWPKAVKVGVQYRGRVEAQRGSSITNGRDDGYYLNRIRLETTVNVTPWLKVFAQAQDAQTLGYNVAAQPPSLTNTFDLRQGYVEARWPAANGFGVRVGRQEIFSASSAWSARPTGATPHARSMRHGCSSRSRACRSTPSCRRSWSSRRTRSIAGSRARSSRAPTCRSAGWCPKGVIEPYVFARFQKTATGELGGVGDAATYTFGARAAGPLPRRFDYGVEVAVQRGHVATDSIGAWAGHYALGWTVVPSNFKPRLVVEFNHASGDGDPRDGRRQTFDQLYPTNHTKYGIADQMGWRNMRDAMVGVEVFPVAKLKLNADAHRMFLATVADGLYIAPGTLKVLNRQAASRTVGTEFDVQASYAFSKELSLGAGVGTLVAGDYLAQSTGAGTVWTPYVLWNIKF